MNQLKVPDAAIPGRSGQNRLERRINNIGMSDQPCGRSAVWHIPQNYKTIITPDIWIYKNTHLMNLDCLVNNPRLHYLCSRAERPPSIKIPFQEPKLRSDQLIDYAQLFYI